MTSTERFVKANKGPRFGFAVAAALSALSVLSGLVVAAVVRSA
jgi:hypothetical protein